MGVRRSNSVAPAVLGADGLDEARRIDVPMIVEHQRGGRTPPSHILFDHALVRRQSAAATRRRPLAYAGAHEPGETGQTRHP